MYLLTVHNMSASMLEAGTLKNKERQTIPALTPFCEPLEAFPFQKGNQETNEWFQVRELEPRVTHTFTTWIYNSRENGNIQPVFHRIINHHKVLCSL